jgi:hypothetical protein
LRPLGPFAKIGLQTKQRLSDIEEIVIRRNTLSEIDPDDISRLSNLQHLYIPYNRLTTLSHLERNLRLKVIDARYNQIRDVDLSGQHFLEELYLAGNRLIILDRFLPKIEHLIDLKILDLRENGVACEFGYRRRVRATFARLEILHGEKIVRRATPKVARKVQRGWSVVEGIRQLGISEVERTIQEKAEEIKKNRKKEAEEAWEKATAAARKQKEDFEMSATLRGAPIADGILLNGRDMREREPKSGKETESRPQTRLFIKVPKYSETPELSQFDATAIRLNKRNITSALKVRVDREYVYSQLGRRPTRLATI